MGEVVSPEGEAQAKAAPGYPSPGRNTRERFCVVCWTRLTRGQRKLCGPACIAKRRARLQDWRRKHGR